MSSSSEVGELSGDSFLFLSENEDSSQDIVMGSEFSEESCETTKAIKEGENSQIVVTGAIELSTVKTSELSPVFWGYENKLFLC